jgi:hypothetical protein
MPNWICREVVDVPVMTPAVGETPVGVRVIRLLRAAAAEKYPPQRNIQEEFDGCYLKRMEMLSMRSRRKISSSPEVIQSGGTMEPAIMT